MNYNHLYYFYVTARAGSVTAAARALRIAQPSLSAQLKTLEEALDRVLLHRSARGVELSQEGEVVFGYCRRIFEPGEELGELMRTGKRQSPRLHIGVSEEVERPFVVELTSRVLKSFPRDVPPRLMMTSDSHGNLLHQLKSRAIDALFTNQPALEEGIRCLGEYRMPVVGVVRPQLLGRHDRAEEISSVVARLRWIMPHRKLRLRSETDAFLEKQGVRGSVVFESDLIASLVRAALEGIGIALLPRPYVHSFIEQGRLAAIGPKDGFWNHGIWLYAVAASEAKSAIRVLKEAFHKSVMPSVPAVAKRQRT